MEVLSQKEMDEILDKIEVEGEDSDCFKPIKGYENKLIKIYDFRNPMICSSENKRILGIIHENFVRDCLTDMNNIIKDFSMSLSYVDQIRYKNFTDQVKIPSVISRIKINPYHEKFEDIILEINPNIINNLYITNNVKVPPKTMLDIVVKNLKKSWESIYPIKTMLLHNTSGYFPNNWPGDLGVLVVIECKVSNYEYMMNIFIPETIISFLRKNLTINNYFKQNEAKSPAIIEDIYQMKVPLIYRIFHSIFSKRRIEFLQVGSILSTERIVTIVDERSNTNLFEVNFDTKKVIKVYKEKIMDKTNFSSVYLDDINIELTVELGRTKKTIKEILSMGEGTIVELDSLAGEPLNVYANNVLIAKGEAVVIDDDFGIRVTEICHQDKIT